MGNTTEYGRAFLRTLNNITRIITTITFSLMTVCVLLQVVSRYVLSLPLPWTEESARFIFIWSIFIGASLAFYEGGHLHVQLLVSRLPDGRMRGFVGVLKDLCCFSFLGMYVVEGAKLCSRLIAMGQTSPAMDFVLMGWVYVAIPLGSLLMILNLLPEAFKNLKKLLLGTKDQGEAI